MSDENDENDLKDYDLEAHDDDHLPAKPRHVVFLFTVLLALFALLVAPQLGFIRDWPLFVCVFLSLIVLSFLASSVEAAIPFAVDDENINRLLRKSMIKYDREWRRVEAEWEDMKANPKKTPLHLKKSKGKRRKLEDKLERHYWKQSVLSGNASKEVYMGSLATFSVFANAALAAFLPAAMTSERVDNWLTSFPLPDFMKIGASFFGDAPRGQPFLPMTAIDFSNDKVFVFLVVSIPVLLVGKLAPKIAGQRFPVFFGFRMFWFAEFCRRFFSWPVQGVRALIKR
ncbi:MAG: hypothetical protein AAF919_01200 [Pseudomonadota bacterium]